MAKSNGRRRIGIFGGTFDPPHIGHLIIAEQAREQLQLDTVLFVPAFIPPHKIEGVSSTAAHRLALLRLAVKGNPNFKVSSIELKRKGVSYTVDTVRALREQFDASELFLIVGSDNFLDFRSWKSPDEILSLATIAVYEREGFENAGKDAQLVRHSEFLKSTRMTVSSTNIRHRVLYGETIRYLVPESVEKYIVRHHLYQPRGRK